MTIGEEFGNELLVNLSRRAESLQQSLDEISADTPYPSEARTALLRILRDLTIAVIRRLEELRIGPPPPEFATIEAPAKRLGVVLNVLFRLMESLVHSDVQRIPSALVPAFEAIARQFVPDALVLVQYLWHYNFGYENLSKVFRDWQTSGLPLAQPLPASLIVLGFPMSEKDNVLLQCAFAHELGHFITQSEALENTVRVTINPGLHQAIPGETRPQLFDVILRWYREMFSDAFGLHLLGPAYFLALAEIGLQGLATPGAKHPPPYFRLTWMLELMRRLRYLDMRGNSGELTSTGRLDPVMKEHFEAWGRFLATSPAPRLSAFYHCAIEAVKEALSNIRAEVDGIVQDKGYTAERFAVEVGPLVKRILQLVPPVDGDGVPNPSFVSILNAGWVVKSTRLNDLEATVTAVDLEEKREVLRILNGLVYKAIEYRLVRQVWARAGEAMS